MLLLLASAFAAPVLRPAIDPLDLAFTAAAAEYGVPRPVLMAIGFEATRWNPDVVSEWGGYGMFDLREGDQDPSLEHAAALLEVDPNRVATEWQLSVRGTAAILADQARSTHGGTLPAQDDLLAWWDAVRAFSGRQEPALQDLNATYIFEVVRDGAEETTRWGRVRIEPHDLDLSDLAPPPPPSSTDSSLASQFYAAASCNYSNYSRGSGDIDMVVIHTVQGSYSGCYSWFANCDAEASAHYVVRSSDGQITQMVSEGDVAWHAGDWDTNLRSVGIEHEGYVEDPGTWYTDAMYRSSAALTADIAARQGVSLDRSHIIGHYEVPGCASGSGGGSGCHTDPGSGWDWDYYMALVTGSGGVADGEIIGVVADSDIYNGPRLAGAQVWIAETGEAATTDGDGMYRFEDIPFGTYTMHATAAGYAEGTCTKTTTGSQEWCSIALLPASGGGGTDTGPDTPPVTDTGTTDEGSGDTAGLGPGSEARHALPGEKVLGDDVSGCGCVASSPRSAGALLAFFALPLVLRRRDRPSRIVRGA
jgi:hypothetical protein